MPKRCIKVLIYQKKNFFFVSKQILGKINLMFKKIESIIKENTIQIWYNCLLNIIEIVIYNKLYGLDYT